MNGSWIEKVLIKLVVSLYQYWIGKNQEDYIKFNRNETNFLIKINKLMLDCISIRNCNKIFIVIEKIKFHKKCLLLYRSRSLLSDTVTYNPYQYRIFINICIISQIRRFSYETNSHHISIYLHTHIYFKNGLKLGFGPSLKKQLLQQAQATFVVDTWWAFPFLFY